MFATRSASAWWGVARAGWTEVRSSHGWSSRSLVSAARRRDAGRWMLSACFDRLGAFCNEATADRKGADGLPVSGKEKRSRSAGGRWRQGLPWPDLACHFRLGTPENTKGTVLSVGLRRQ
ncbi:hypothetical protein ACLOJK_023028 [Asimina triloba]